MGNRASPVIARAGQVSPLCARVNMTENIENLILEHLKRFQTGQDRIEHELREIKSRLSNLESGQSSIIQHLGR